MLATPMMRLATPFIVFFALLLTSCYATRITEYGTVQAHRAEDYEKVAQALERLVPQVRQVLESPRTDLPRVRVLRSARARYGDYATCYSNRIDLGADAMPGVNRVTAHELVHWYAQGTAFEGLPTWMEEGLAEYVAASLVRAVVTPAELVETWSRADWYEDRAWRRLQKNERHRLGEIGALVVARLGIDRVRKLAEARVAPTCYLWLAGLFPENPDPCLSLGGYACGAGGGG